MAQKYKVLPNEVLSQIAAKFKFRDGGAAIWQANRALIGDNPDILAPGIILMIPDLQEKDEDKGTDSKHHFQVPSKLKNLCVSLQSPDGKLVQGWRYQVKIGPKSWDGSTGDSPFCADKIPASEMTGQLKVQDTALFGLWGFDPELIELNIGGLDPMMTGDAGRIAVQKILTNLGYYNGPLDGDFTDSNEEIRRALRAFQRQEGITPAHGMADQATCDQLIKAQGNVMPPSKLAPEGVIGEPAKNRNLPLPVGTIARLIEEKVTTSSGYQEPVTTPVLGAAPKRTKLGTFHFFPHRAFVAPCDPGDEAKNPNVIRMPSREFIFLDCGRWLGTARDFGLIWGPHAYLCQYASPSMKPDDYEEKASTYGTVSDVAAGVAIAAVVGIAAVAMLAPAIAIPVIAVLAVVAIVAAVAAIAAGGVAQNATEGAEDSAGISNAEEKIDNSPTDRLDMLFFQQMNAALKGTGAHINIVKHASAQWASGADFDWNRLMIVIPDMHLMNGDVASVWKQKPHDLQPELDFLDFADKITNIGIKDQLSLVQIGDSYDLWVGCAPRLFKKNDIWSMELKGPVQPDSDDPELKDSVADPAKTVRNWIKDIQGLRGNWVQRIMDRRVQDKIDSQENADRYREFLKQDCEDDAPTAWTCSTSDCPAHSRPEDKCVPHTCGRLEPACPGHADPMESCTDGLSFSCGAVGCNGHGTAQEVCTGGIWRCGRVIWKGDDGWQQDCSGHGAPNESCEKPGWLNPAEAGFRLLEQRLFERLVYVYGNHDNYLIIPETTEGIAPRARYYDALPGIFVEHGHRMEGTFFESGVYPLPVNFDGQPSGYETTIGLYNEYRHTVPHNPIGQLWANLKQAAGKPVADEWAGIHDQPQYRGEMAQIWLGRQASGNIKPFHTYTIGHTHMPNLWYVPIDAWRL